MRKLSVYTNVPTSNASGYKPQSRCFHTCNQIIESVLVVKHMGHQTAFTTYSSNVLCISFEAGLVAWDFLTVIMSVSSTVKCSCKSKVKKSKRMIIIILLILLITDKLVCCVLIN